MTIPSSLPKHSTQSFAHTSITLGNAYTIIIIIILIKANEKNLFYAELMS